MEPLAEGKRAPAFALSDKDECTHRLEDIAGEYKVIFFYPKDNTPGCTVEAISFTKDIKKFAAFDATLIGISGGDAKSKTKFCVDNKLKVLLLSDPDFKVAKKYGVYGEKSFMGRKFLGIARATFIVDSTGKILKVFFPVKPEGHSKEVLAFLKASARK